MNSLDRNTVRDISEDMMEALKSVALKHGVQFNYKGGSYTPTNATYRIEAAIIGDGGVVETRERKEYQLYADSFGLKKEWLDQSFVQGTDKFIIIGLSTRKRKNPILCKNETNGRTYVFPVYMVKLLMDAQKKVMA